jgi:hypothetical protein
MANATAGFSGVVPMPPLREALVELFTDQEFLVRCAASGVVATLLYCVWGVAIHHMFYRKVRYLRGARAPRRPAPRPACAHVHAPPAP